MTAPLSLDPVRDFFTGEPLEAATRRICASLTIDRQALRLLRRAASRGEPRAALTYAWAAGARTGSETLGSPVAVADLAAQAADLAPDEPAAHICLGLAHAGSFGGRRATPLTARRAFVAAARLEPDNVVAQLLLAAARFGTGDLPGADKAVAAALDAGECRPYYSPLANDLHEAAPWISWPLQQLWPERAEPALRFATDALLRQRRRADVLRLAGLLTATGPHRGSWLLSGLGLATRGLRAAVADGQRGAEEALTRAEALTVRVEEEQRALARRFEAAAGRLVRGGGLGATTGAALGLVGLVRSRRRWPPPIIAVAGAVTGRAMAWTGLALTAASLALALADNGPARLRRRLIEARLVAAEERTCAEASQALQEILASVGVPR